MRDAGPGSAPTHVRARRRAPTRMCLVPKDAADPSLSIGAELGLCVLCSAVSDGSWWRRGELAWWYMCGRSLLLLAMSSLSGRFL